MLDVEYFHVVFTVPQDVGAIAAQNKATVYNLLFRATRSPKGGGGNVRCIRAA